MVQASRPEASAPDRAGSVKQTIFASARWYDGSINWPARLGREIPLLCELFGPPGSGGILDAGCGTGRQAVALARRGYTVTGADASTQMLEVARSHAEDEGVAVRFVESPYQALADRLDPGFDGVFCIGNSLAAAGSADALQQAVANFAALLRPGGRLFVQVLNFPPMRDESPCVRGPRVSVVDGVEYLSIRLFHFAADPASGPQGSARVTNVTLWNDGAWRKRSNTGILYPLSRDELTAWCTQADLAVQDTYGAYDRSPFDPRASVDLILVAQRNPT